MHQMGSHGPAYYRRSPPKFKEFLPECTTNALQQCAHEQIINAFDNTIVYTDHFLASAIDWLQRRQDEWAPALVYLSDHGESLGENNLYLHGMPYRWAPDAQKHVPWIFWLSAPFQRQAGIAAACLQQRQDDKLSHDDYFHTAIGMLGVQTSVYDAARDITVDCR
jgi:lipid A ethanolaminephosphotransferase